MGVAIKTQAGFTIIEVMLFLAVTGMLAAAVLVGSGVAIGQQRYRDSVSSLKSYMQQQYSEVMNVSNDRSGEWACNDAAHIVEAEGVAGEVRGTSDCVILGRFITIDNTGTKLSAANVVASRISDTVEQDSDIAEIRNNYRLGVSPVVTEDAEVSWGGQVVAPKTATPMPLSVLIVRSPLSGSILTFIVNGVRSNPGAIVEASNMGQRDLCVNAEPGSFVGSRMAVRINAFATGQSSVLVPAESENVCD